MIFGMTRGELVMVAAISALVLLAGQIPRIVRALERGGKRGRHGGHEPPEPLNGADRD